MEEPVIPPFVPSKLIFVVPMDGSLIELPFNTSSVKDALCEFIVGFGSNSIPKEVCRRSIASCI